MERQAALRWYTTLSPAQASGSFLSQFLRSIYPIAVLRGGDVRGEERTEESEQHKGISVGLVFSACSMPGYGYHQAWWREAAALETARQASLRWYTMLSLAHAFGSSSYPASPSHLVPPLYLPCCSPEKASPSREERERRNLSNTRGFEED